MMKNRIYIGGAVILVVAAGALFANREATVAHSVPAALVAQDKVTMPKLEAVAAKADGAETAQQDGAGEPQFRYDHFRVGNRNIKAMLADGNTTWVGTSGGVIQYDLTKDDYVLHDNTNGLLSNGVFHLSKVDGELWVGTYGGGLSVLNQETKKWRNYNVPDGMGDSFVYDTLKTSNGDVWIATWSGANRIPGGNLDDTENWELYTVENTDGGLPNDWVYGLTEGANGEIWFATEGGLARLKDNVWENWNHEKGLGAAYEMVKSDTSLKSDPGQASSHHAVQKQEQGLGNVDIAYNPNYVIALVYDRKGRVWTGTWGAGLSMFDGKTWKTYTTKDGLPANHIFMLHEDEDGTLWIGTNNGLAIFDGENFTLYDKSHGIFSDAVFSMAIASDGTAWIGSYGGIARFYNGLKDETVKPYTKLH
ncbi:MAG: hypothetical protein JKY27_01625 [Magnetovibrio sp.]|nr:hypothetical protein [Magnetovibrio sp.]